MMRSILVINFLYMKSQLIHGLRLSRLMKINQLFIKKVDVDLLVRVLNCFGLTDLNDKRFFCKLDMIQHSTVIQFAMLRESLEPFYLPCKAKIYMNPDSMNEKRAITILKQLLRLHGYYLISKERNINNRKIIFYQMMNEKDRTQSQHMKKFDVTNIISFD